MANVIGRSTERPSNISTLGATPSGSTCWELRRPSFPSANRRKACRSECRFPRVPGRKNWCWRLPLPWNRRAATGASRRFVVIFSVYTVRTEAIESFQAMTEEPRSRGLTQGRALTWLLAFLTVSAAYLYAFPQPNVFYAGVVLLHALAGVVTAFLLLLFLAHRVAKSKSCLAPGLDIADRRRAGRTRPDQDRHRTTAMEPDVRAHRACAWPDSECCSLKRPDHGDGWLEAFPVTPSLWQSAWLSIALLVAGRALSARVALATSSAHRESGHASREHGPARATAPAGPFFPSSAQVYGGQKIPSKFFMESESCKRCHEDIYNQWFSSAHHFSSFNNQWYRKSIEYMQDTVGTRPSKWCGGCHDPAVLYSGLMDTPIKQIVHRPESQAGLGCMMCHSIAAVKSTMGQGDFYLEYPKLHEMAAATNPVARFFHDFLVKLNPEPHRRVFLEAVHARTDRRVLLHLPQGPSRRAGEPLPLDSRLQRIRQLAGQRGLWRGSTVVLLSG